MCTDKFRNTGIAMYYMPWGVHYVDKATLMEDIGCTKICDESQRQVCAILNAFSGINETRKKEEGNLISIRRSKNISNKDNSSIDGESEGNAGKKIKGNAGIKGSKLCKDKKRRHCPRKTN